MLNDDTHFMPLVFFCTPENINKTAGFLMFKVNVDRNRRHEMGVQVGELKKWQFPTYTQIKLP